MDNPQQDASLGHAERSDLWPSLAKTAQKVQALLNGNFANSELAKKPVDDNPTFREFA